MRITATMHIWCTCVCLSDYVSSRVNVYTYTYTWKGVRIFLTDIWFTAPCFDTWEAWKNTSLNRWKNMHTRVAFHLIRQLLVFGTWKTRKTMRLAWFTEKYVKSVCFMSFCFFFVRCIIRGVHICLTNTSTAPRVDTWETRKIMWFAHARVVSLLPPLSLFFCFLVSGILADDERAHIQTCRNTK